MKVVKVLWVDSCNSNMNWTVAEDIEIEPMYIDSFGIVIKDTDEFLAIAQNYGDNPEQYSNITTIPKGCIKEVFVIHEDNVCEHKQKPAWSEEDKEEFQIAIDTLVEAGQHDSAHWLKSLKDRVQPKQEWSEEDETCLKNAIMYCEWARDKAPDLPCYETSEKSINWLKSIKDRYTWKPTEKQVKALEHFVRSVGESGYASPYDNDTKLIYSLLEQLKQL